MRWLRYALSVGCLIALGACTGGGPAKHDLSPGVDPASPTSATLPGGWRWESYRGVEVGVPGDWGWGNGSQRLSQWCTNRKDPKPMVGRPGASTLVGCIADALGPEPETLVVNTGWIVAFEDATSDSNSFRIPSGGDRTLVRVGGVIVVVQVPERLREQIVATVHTVTADHAGCPVFDSVSDHPAQRPAPASEGVQLKRVTVVSVCRYELAVRQEHRTAPLLSSSRFEGAPAAKLIKQIAAAPHGGGPNRATHCTHKYGDEMIVLRVGSSTDESEIYARYSGCDHNGFDDGSTVRTLTRAPMQTLIKGPNAPGSWYGELNPILAPGQGRK
jgi:hypothetical protein